VRHFATERDKAGTWGYAMTATIKSLGIDRLPVDERLILVQEIWDSIAADTAAVPLTDKQRVELQNRIEEDDAKPDDVTSWEHVKASTVERLRRWRWPRRVDAKAQPQHHVARERSNDAVRNAQGDRYRINGQQQFDVELIKLA
jgi:putative addiction module component (TIGR02574 family)